LIQINGEIQEEALGVSPRTQYNKCEADGEYLKGKKRNSEDRKKTNIKMSK